MMNIKDRERIINLIFETTAEIDEASPRLKKYARGPLGPCYKETINYDENISKGIYRVINPFQSSSGKQYNIDDRLEGASTEFESLSSEEKKNFKECWGEHDPLFYISASGKKLEIKKDSPPNLKRSLGAQSGGHSVETVRSKTEKIDSGKLKGQPKRQYNFPPGGLALSFERGGDLNRPDMWRITNPDNPDEYFLVVPIDCEETDEFISKYERFLRVAQRMWRANPVFIKCYDKSKKNLIKTIHQPSGKFNIVKPIVDFDKPEYRSTSMARTAKIDKGGKASSQEQIKVKINRYMGEVFNKNGEFYDIMVKRSLPPIVFDNRFLNRHNDEITNDSVQLQGLSYIAYDNDMDFLRKIIARTKGVKYDFRIVETEDVINLKELSIGDTIKIPVNARYDAVKREDDTLTLSYYPNEEGLGLSTLQGKAKNNYIKGKIFKYDHGKNLITLKIDEVYGNAAGNRWLIEYTDVDIFYQARAFNKVYKNWDIDKAISLAQEKEGTETSLALGRTKIYDLDYKGVISQNPAYTLYQNWTLSGRREGNQFVWEMTMGVKYGRSQDRNVLGQTEFKKYILNPNSIYDNGTIQSRATAEVDPNIYFGQEYVCTRAYYDEELDMKFNVGDRIPSVQLAGMKKDNVKNFVVYTIMDYLPVRQAFEEVIEDFMRKVESIDPQSALSIIDLQQSTISESNDLVSQIMRKIKSQIR